MISIICPIANRFYNLLHATAWSCVVLVLSSTKNCLKILSVLETSKALLKLLQGPIPCHTIRYIIIIFGLEHLDSRSDVITQKMFQEVKDQKHPLHHFVATCVQESNGFTAHLAKLPVTDEISSHTCVGHMGGPKNGTI